MIRAHRHKPFSGRMQTPATMPSGFTLMELLVAVTLLGILMVMLFGGLQLGTRVWEASDAILEDSSETQAVRRFLEDRFEEAIPMPFSALNDAGEGERAGDDGEDGDSDEGGEIVFSGTRTDLRFISTMPRSLGGGPFMIELSLRAREGRDQANDLVVTWQRVGREAMPTNGEPSQRVILDNIAGIAFGYFGMLEGNVPTGWQSTWSAKDNLPDLIQLQILFDEQDKRTWPSMIVSPMVDDWYDVAD